MADSNLATRQHELMQYLTGHGSEIADHVVDQGNVSVDARLAIYRNAYRMRFTETLETDHEMLGLYLGDQLFDQMAADYIDTCPSEYRSLRQYADRLPVFLAESEPFSQHPILSELASFERLLLTAFDAEEGQRLDQAQLAALPAEQWPAMQLKFHPSMQLFKAQWNSVESWQALKAGQAPTAAQSSQGIWLLWRNRERLTEFASVTTQEHSVLLMALEGAPFAQLCEALLENYRDDEAGQVAVQYLIGWMEKGLLLNHEFVKG
ncbi:MAG: hypothetical protein ACI9JM_001097 [Halioglobus sp.]|jgi:hypothetical protein